MDHRGKKEEKGKKDFGSPFGGAKKKKTAPPDLMLPRKKRGSLTGRSFLVGGRASNKRKGEVAVRSDLYSGEKRQKKSGSIVELTARRRRKR